jgi:putative SOS response-associated peptidase YedK
MPAILDPKDYARWLGEEPTEPPHLMMMLKPYPVTAMEAYSVSTRVTAIAAGLVEQSVSTLLSLQCVKQLVGSA